MKKHRLPAKSPVPILIDTDMAPDDWIAILFLLNREDVRVGAITVCGTGEAHAVPGARNALKLLALAGDHDIPVAAGRSRPLEGTRSFPRVMRWAMDRLLLLPLPDSPRSPSPLSAVDLMASTLRESDQPVTVFSFGPLTNLALCLQKHPAAAANISSIYCMGGALEVPGNIHTLRPFSRNRTAEWNIYIDPVAANIVFRSQIPVTIVPLDASNPVPVTIHQLENLDAMEESVEAQFCARTLTRLKSRVSSGKLSLWDPLTAVVGLEPDLAFFSTYTIEVVENGPEAGRTVIQQGGAAIRVCTWIDPVLFERSLLGAFARSS